MLSYGYMSAASKPLPKAVSPLGGVADFGDRANITMEGAVCAKQKHGTTAPDFGHQQVAPMGENHFWALDT